jgi:hypothetical protein
MERISYTNPAAKIIVVLRNPVDRAYSQYLMIRKWGLEDLPFMEACDREEGRIIESRWARGHYGYLSRSKYSGQIENIFKYFNREQVFFVLFEDFVRDQKKEFAKIQDWLGLERHFPLSNIKENQNREVRFVLIYQLFHNYRFAHFRKIIGKAFSGIPTAKRVMRLFLSALAHKPETATCQNLTHEERVVLLGYFKEDIAKTSTLTGMNLSAWIEGN